MKMDLLTTSYFRKNYKTEIAKKYSELIQKNNREHYLCIKIHRYLVGVFFISHFFIAYLDISIGFSIVGQVTV